MSDGIYFRLEDLPLLAEHASFTPNRTTVVYVHGFNQSPTKPNVQKIHDAYISNGQSNLILLDWAVPASANYVQAVINEIAVNPNNSNTSRNKSCKTMNFNLD